MLDLEPLHLLERLFFIQGEFLLPRAIEVLHMLLTDLDVFAHLSLLDILSHLILEHDDLGLQEPHLLHQVLVELILVHFAALLGKQLHFLLDERKYEDLLVLVQYAVTTLVEDVNEVLRIVQAKQIIDVLTALLEHKTDIGLIEEAFLAEVSFLDCCPDLFALARTSDQRPCFPDQLLDLVPWHIGQALVVRERFRADTPHHLISFDCAPAN